MSFTIVLDKGRANPVFICDYCGKEITDASDGNYGWNEPEGVQHITDVKFLHKVCSIPYNNKFGTLLFNMGIDNLMVYLLNNLNLTPKRLKEAYRNAETLSRL